MITKDNISHSGRCEWLDRIKGLGILLVMLGHVFTTDHPLIRIIQGTNVSLFFLASGYLMELKKEREQSLAISLKRKIKGILKPYFFFSGLMILWLLIRLYVLGYGNSYEILHCMADIFCFEGISALWFLAILFWGETVCLLTGKKCSPLLQTAIFLVLGMLLLNSLPRLENTGEMAFKLLRKGIRIAARTFMAAAFLSMGSLIYSVKKKRLIHRPVTPIITLSVSVGGLLGFTGMIQNGPTDFHYLIFGNFAVYFVDAVLVFLFFSLLLCKLPSDPILPVLGRCSLLLMGTHLIALDFVQVTMLLAASHFGYALEALQWMKCLWMLAIEGILVFLYLKK